MSAIAWVIATVIVALLWLAFRRKQVADEVRVFVNVNAAVDFAVYQENSGFHCWIRKRRYGLRPSMCVWQVRCYRRKDRQS